jgi:hypothetical protein
MRLSRFMQVIFLNLVPFLLLTCVSGFGFGSVHQQCGPYYTRNTTRKETEPGQGNVRNRFAYPSPNVKRPRSCLAESQQMAATTNPRGGDIGSRSSVEKDGGRDEEDATPSLVISSSALIASYPNEEVIREESTHYEIPSGWKRVKLEPDC